MPPYHWWRTVFFLIPAIAVYTIVLGTVSLASSFFDRSGRFAHKCARAWSWLILKTTGVTVEHTGLDRLPRGTSYVFAANHQSIYDIPVLFWTLDFELRILAKASLGSFPFLGWHLARTGHVLVERKNPGADLFRQVRRLMHAGYSLFVFPEGTRSLDGSLARFRAGTFMMAIEAGLPVVPVAVDGSRFVMRKGQLMTSPGHVRVTVLDPIATAGRRPEDARAFAREVQQAIAGALGHASRAEDGGRLGVTLDVAPALAAIVTPACLAFDGVTVVEHDHRLDAAFAEAEARLRAGGTALDAAVQRTRALYRAIGLDPTKTRPSSEALLRRVRRGDTLPRVNTIVDLCNWCSVETQIAFGVYDRDRIAGEALALRIGAEGEGYDGIRKDRVNVAGRLTLVDAEGPFGNPTSDSLRTSVSTATTRVLFVLFTPAPTPADRRRGARCR